MRQQNISPLLRPTAELPSWNYTCVSVIHEYVNESHLPLFFSLHLHNKTSVHSILIYYTGVKHNFKFNEI